MSPQDTATSTVLGGQTELERHEELLLEQMTAHLKACRCCGTDGLYIAAWTPFRTVKRILCAVCLEQMWVAP